MNVAVQQVVLNLWWDLLAATSDLRVVQSVMPVGRAQHPPCQASRHEPDRNQTGTTPATGSEPDQTWIEADRNRVGSGSGTCCFANGTL